MDILFWHIYASIILSLCIYYIYVVMEEHFFSWKNDFEETH